MQKDLETMVPQLDLEAQAMKDLLAKLEVDTKNADVVKEAVSKDEAIAKVRFQYIPKYLLNWSVI